MNGVTLILGGARSGKSDRALALADMASALDPTHARRPVFVATAEAADAEMAERIARHRLERGPAWRLEECPVDLVDVLARHDDANDVLLVDCLTLWLSNLFDRHMPIEPTIAALVDALTGSRRRATLLVANEIGLGLVPPTALGRRFRDAHGRMNRELAAVAGSVELVVAGLPMEIKSRTGGARPSR